MIWNKVCQWRTCSLTSFVILPLSYCFSSQTASLPFFGSFLCLSLFKYKQTFGRSILYFQAKFWPEFYCLDPRESNLFHLSFYSLRHQNVIVFLYIRYNKIMLQKGGDNALTFRCLVMFTFCLLFIFILLLSLDRFIFYSSFLKLYYSAGQMHSLIYSSFLTFLFISPSWFHHSPRQWLPRPSCFLLFDPFIIIIIAEEE